MARRTDFTLAITLASVLALFAGMIAVMWQLGFFRFTGTDPSSKIVVAALTLVGTFVGTVVTIIGVLLKHSIDRQTERRLEIESERNAALALEEKRRLKLEAAVRALQLFSTSSGAPTPAVQRDGALFALASLDMHDLTLQITDDLLRKDELGAGTAANLLDHALRRGELADKEAAVVLLSEHAARMLTPAGYSLPSAIGDWIPGLPDYVREWAPLAIGEILLARPASEWLTSWRGNFFHLISILGIAWTQEGSQRLKDNVGAILQAVLKSDTSKSIGTLWHPRMDVDTIAIRRTLGEHPIRSENLGEITLQIVGRLDKWANPEEKTA